GGAASSGAGEYDAVGHGGFRPKGGAPGGGSAAAACAGLRSGLGTPVRGLQQRLRQRRASVGISADDEDGVVTGDRAEDGLPSGVIDRRGEELGGPRWRAD